MVLQKTITIDTQRRGSYEITKDVAHVVDKTRSSQSSQGLCNVFVQHTSASLMICENADPTVLSDLETFMSRLVPDGDGMFRHTQEGPDDMPAHVRSILTQPAITLPIDEGRCLLGTWQGIYLWEHRHRGHRRNITITVYS